MLRKIYLTFLHLKFQILRLLDLSGTNRDENLLQVSSSMLEVCMGIATARDHDSQTPMDLSSVVSLA